MTEYYRLVFRGEVLEGQHPAVVRRRLGQSLGLEEADLERMFSGDPFVVAERVERNEAARQQTEFKKAGGRLRVIPADRELSAEADREGTPGQLAEGSAQSSGSVGVGEPRSGEPLAARLREVQAAVQGTSENPFIGAVGPAVAEEIAQDPENESPIQQPDGMLAKPVARSPIEVVSVSGMEPDEFAGLVFGGSTAPDDSFPLEVVTPPGELVDSAETEAGVQVLAGLAATNIVADEQEIIEIEAVLPLPLVEEESFFEPSILPVGSDVLSPMERDEWQPRELDTSHLTLATTGIVLEQPGTLASPAPDTSHLSLQPQDSADQR